MKRWRGWWVLLIPPVVGAITAGLLFAHYPTSRQTGETLKDWSGYVLINDAKSCSEEVWECSEVVIFRDLRMIRMEGCICKP